MATREYLLEKAKELGIDIEPQSEDIQTPAPTPEPQTPVVSETNSSEGLDSLPKTSDPFVGTNTEENIPSLIPTLNLPRASDPFANGSTIVEEAAKATSFGEKNHELTVDDISDMSFEDIVRLASTDHAETGLSFESRQRLSAALRGSTSTSALGDLLLQGTQNDADKQERFTGSNSTAAKALGAINPAIGIMRGLFGETVNEEKAEITQGMEDILEEKYQDFVANNPEYDESGFTRALNGLRTGTPLPEIEGIEGLPLVPKSRAVTDTIASGATAGFSDELVGLFDERAGESIEQSKAQLREEDFVAAMAAETLGAVLPSSKILQGVNRVFGSGYKAAATAGIIEGAAAGAGNSDTDNENTTRLTDALLGGALGGTVGLVSEPLARAASSGILKLTQGTRRTAAETKNVNAFLSSLEEQSGVSASKIQAGLADGKNINRIMLEEGVPEDRILSITSGLVIDQRGASAVQSAATNRTNRTSSEALNRRTSQDNLQAQRLDETGQQVEAARTGPGTTEQARSVIQTNLNGPQGTQFYQSLSTKIASNLQARSDITKAAGYPASKNARFVVDESTGDIHVIRNNTNSKKIPKDGLISEDEVIINGEVYEAKNLVDYEPDLLLTQSVQSDIQNAANALKPGDSVDQNAGARAAELNANISRNETDLNSTLAAANDSRKLASQVKAYQQQVDKILNSQSSVSQDFDNLIKTASEMGSSVSSAQKLTMISNALDQALATNKPTALLNNDNKALRTMVKDVLEEQGMTPNQIKDVENMMVEMKTLSKVSGANLTPDTQMSWIRSVLNGSLGRWYLGPGKAIAASFVFNAVSALGKQTTVANNIAKSVRKVNPETRNKIIQTMLDAPDAEFQKIINAVLRARTDKERLSNLIKIGLIATPTSTSQNQ